MKISRYVFLLMGVLPVAHLLAANAEEAAIRFNPQSVWKPSPNADAWGPRCSSVGEEPQCRFSEMQENGATAQAIAFTKRWHNLTQDIVFLSDFRELGRVDLAEITGPTLNDPNTSQYLLVNGNPEIVYLWSPINRIDIRKDPSYQSLSRKFPALEIWPMNSFQTMQQLPNGGQRFIFNFILLNGCRSCEVAGQAKFAYDFDKTGNFVKAQLLGLEESRNRD